MHITFLGHAGFCIESDGAVILVDPWLSPLGAFDSSWFQFPCNHHLTALVHEKLRSSSRRRYIYISHEHKDHFDPVFLGGLQTDDFTFVIPRFKRTELHELLQRFPSQGIVRCDDGGEVLFPGGRMVVFLDDSEMDRDSALLVQADGSAFLDLNDCKIHDRLAEIADTLGPIDVFTAQFSGAGWHPVCYSYSRKVYEAISMRKRISKFESVARTIEKVQPRIFLTSAGPPCFLDPGLQHLNFEPVNIFPRAPLFLSYLQKRPGSGFPTHCAEPMPGDILDAHSATWLSLARERVTNDNFEEYIRAYADRYEGYFRARQEFGNVARRLSVGVRLKAKLEEKLAALTLRDRVQIPLYFQFEDDPDFLLRVDFTGNNVEFAHAITEQRYYSIQTPSWEISRVLDGLLTWEDFTLTFRMKLNRNPDVYHIVMHGFLMMEPEDMNRFCARVLDAESHQERALVEARGRRYSIHRRCPHQGADLTKGWIKDDRYLICPRHRWKFDLADEGNCTDCAVSIHAFAVEEN